ncbi:MAG: sulfite exporter TauE/SafE family protein [Rhodospirillales bacterium]|nr:sulfite exporter TauE/SafE family protein [Rhodospirillales bacterium]
MEELSIFVEFLVSGAEHCQNVIENRGDLLGSLFVAGLVGGGAHCIAMCGPFVLAQSVSRLEARPASEMREFHRLSGAALIPYHLGRLTTYMGLGALAGLLAGEVTAASGFRWLSAVLLALAAILFLGYGIRKFSIRLPWSSGKGTGWLSRVAANMAKPLFDRPTGLRGYGLGVTLGFLPCGFLYGALAAAGASAGDNFGALAGALVMGAFALGTVPSLLAVGLAGHVVGERWQGVVARATPVLMIFNALILSLMAVRSIA